MEKDQGLPRCTVQLEELAPTPPATLAEAQAQREQESAEQYHNLSLCDGIPVGIYRTTPAGQIVDVNLGFVYMMGYPSREAVLAANAASLYVDPEARLRWQALMAQEGVVQDFETQLYKYDGTAIWVSNSARAVRDDQGRVLCYEGSIEDITGRKRTEAELRKYQEHLADLVEARTKELRKSEERYRTLFDGVPVGLYRSTLDGKVLDYNLAAVHLLGYPSREAALAVNSADVYVDAQDRLRWQALMEKEGIVRDFEVQMRRYDGTTIWVRDTAQTIRDEQSQVLYYEGTLEDITEHVGFEEEVRRQKDYFEALFVNSPVAVVTADREARILSWNPMAEKLFGYTPEEAIGQRLDDLVANDASVRAEAAAYSFQATHLGRVQVTTRRTRKDGSWVDVDLLALPLVLAGVKAGFIVIYHDITARKRFEEELRRQKEYFEALVVNSPAAVMTIDLESKVVSWNPMAEKLLGYTQEEAVGRNIDDLVANDPRIRQEALNYTRQLETEGRVQVTTERTRKDGSLVEVEALGLPVIVAGERLGYICIYHDISELQQARRAAEAASQAKSAFLANMSHELRTPLNAILGFTQLTANDTNLTAEQQENLRIINRSGEHLLTLINDVLEMSKIEAGRVSLNEQVFALHDLLDDLEEMFSLRAEDKGLTLSVRRARGLPRYVVTDEDRLRQVLSNLLSNAVKFTQAGSVTLRVNVVGKGQRPADSKPKGPYPRATIHFAVEDTGPGIAPEDLALIFEPFVQATSGRQSHEGAGLGLSISRQFVRLMGGEITASSKVGQGSVFQFDVQVGLADVAALQAIQPARQVVGLAPDQPLYRLLVAEDRETNRRLLVKLLAPLGLAVREAVNGQEAMAIWEQWKPHLIWMDMRMPVMDGYEATRRIKATPQGQATIIIALSASAFEEDRERMLAGGCDDVVRKPFRQAEIYEMLARHLGVRFVYAEEEAQSTIAQPLPPAALAALPAGWLADLQQATVKADWNLMMTLIGRLRAQNAALADALADLARDFEYKKILAWIQESGG